MYRNLTFVDGIVETNNTYSLYADAYAIWRKLRIKPGHCERVRLFRCNEYGQPIKCLKDKPRLIQRLPRASVPGNISSGRDLRLIIPDAALLPTPNPRIIALVRRVTQHPNDKTAAKALRKKIAYYN